ncbi:kinesin-like protein KIN-4C [Aristolochia californica]|uniref:kinesin-like protein KIN-4C n=1 Tax=Aristolochia californica TaxID=171875 RepID=UPI0035D8DDA4
METTDTKIVAGGNAHEKDTSQCVKVAVNIRPLITTELLVGCTDCVTVTPGEPQVQIGSHAFTFDHVFGGGGAPSSKIFYDCVAPLVESLFNGYNATVLAYGQTGSGKTYTMGTNYTTDANSCGIIPKVMDSIFSKVEALKESTEFLIRVSFIEIFKEEVFDLLDQSPVCPTKNDVTAAKTSAISKAPIQIRETVNGGITLAGVTEAEVRSKEEMASFLARGSLCRATGSTNMNSQSSRSHAIFTISIDQKKIPDCTNAGAINDEIADDILCAKFHLVDLAGSERAKRTGADGLRFKEGIHINKGLLALGNVISALGDDKKRKEGGHVPYRDSKLTRLLQDSLGGNTKTVMIACVSPADTNAEETLNTLKYANRARNIQNKAIINRDPMAAQMQRMRSQLEQLQAELLFLRGEGAPLEELQILRYRISTLEASNVELRKELQESQITCDRLAQCALDAQVEKDQLMMKIQSAKMGKSWEEIDDIDRNQDTNLLRNYVAKIQELEGELYRLQSFSNSNKNSLIGCLELEEEELHSKESFCPSLSDELDEAEKEREHSSIQDKLDKELQELDKRLELKEAQMKNFSKADTSVLKQHYEKKLLDLEQEKKDLQKEIEELRLNLANISSSSDDGAQKLKEEYLQKLNALESQVSELKRKQDAQSQLLRQKQKSDDAAKKLQDEIQRIKSQKVQLQHKIKHESEQFRAWKVSREKEVLQLRKEGRRNEYEMHKLLALNQRQKMVLQRKSEEAAMATKRLKELLEARKTSAREIGGRNGSGPSIQALMQAIEHELEVTVRVHEVRSKYERQMEERTTMAKEVAKLKEESQMLKQNTVGDCPSAMSPGARNSRIFALENMLATSSSTLVAMASQLSEAEERERLFSGKGRWNQVHSLAEAKNLMNYLFNLASSSKCQLRDRELDCREKDSVVKEQKEKVVKLSSMLRQLEAKMAEMHQPEKLLNVSLKKAAMETDARPEAQNSNNGEEGHNYDLRKCPRSSQIFWTGLDDMDTSESDHSYLSDMASDSEWEKSELKQSKRVWPKKDLKPGPHKTVLLTPIEVENTSDEAVCPPMVTKSALETCCSCSRYSKCKTSKCACRNAGTSCGDTCGCMPTKCANRLADFISAEGEESPQDEITGGDKDILESDLDRSKELATHGALLLQSAFGQKPVEVTEDDGPKRKPLSDIGNKIVNSGAPRQQNQRKKWGKKSVVQIIQNTPPASAESGDITEAHKPTNETVRPIDIPLKFPRAMASVTINSNPLRERNSNTISDEALGDKDVGPTARSPPRQFRELEKENRS